MLKHFYKGFVETRPDKSSTTKRKGKTEFTSFEEADQRWLNFGGVIGDDYVLIDVDDDYENKYTENEKLVSDKKSRLMLDAIKYFGWKCYVTRSPHGVHTIWKAPKAMIKETSNSSTYCGLIVDYKPGKNNSYECVRRNGKYDEVLWECDDPQMVPDLLLPHKNDLFDMSTGSRNDALFRHQTPLFKIDCDVEHTIEFINKFVLAEPVSTNELKIITREEALEGAKEFATTPTSHDEVGDMLIEDNNYYYLSNYGVCSYNSGNISDPLEKLDLERTIRRYNKKLKNKDVSEITNYIIAMSPYVEDVKRHDYLLPVENGIIDVRTGELHDYNDDDIIVNKLPITYDPTVTECPEFDNWIEDVTSSTNDKVTRDQDAIDMIYECISNGFSMNNRLNKMYILYGATRNGKSTLSKFIHYFFGAKNVKNADLSALNGGDADKHKATLQHKRFWLGDDIDGARLDKTADLKKIITGEEITGRPIYGSPVIVKPYCGLMFGCNGIPYIGNGNDVDAIMERVMFMHFKRYYGDRPDVNIDDVLQTEKCKTYVLNMAIKAWQRVRSEGYTEYSTSVQLKDQYRNELNPYQRFVRTRDLSGLTTTEVWDVWCQFVKEEELDDNYLFNKNKICKSIRTTGGYSNRQDRRRRWEKLN